MSNRRTYYDARDLHVDNFDVNVLAGETEFVAKRISSYHGRNREISRKWRVRIATRDPRGLVRYDYHDLPKHVIITRWRPIDRATFPGPLPRPAHMLEDVSWQSKPMSPVPPEAEDQLDWLGDYSAPPDISAREVEIQIYRALRTERSPGAVKSSRGRYVDSIVATALSINGKLWDDEHVDASYIAPGGGVAWEPTRKDFGDWDTALGWWARLSRAHREVFELRSLNPPYSFRAIAERHHPPRSHEWARKRYKAAITAAQRIANNRAR